MFLEKKARPLLVQKRRSQMASRTISFGRRLLVLVVSIGVALLVVAGVWISVAAMNQKIKISRGANQIFDIVDMSRRFAGMDHNLGTMPHDDILAALAHADLLQVGGGSDNGLRSVSNPWGGTLMVYTAPDNLFKVETVVPSRACVRILELLTPNLKSLGLKQIDAKGFDESWRQIYLAKRNADLGGDEIFAGCRSDQLVILDLTFTLR